ncbi:beta-ketoacyl-ACP synthase III [Actinomadura roseirufa]|uniref:beta-ketoacyl-ACP synthase III n=1 Tax=Actinomadura roseirufa TaxID=2094049 RepID=UPI001040EAB5|nr:beta-ketoacyl-ACP synthase III [Actinomadura roseirufa]
MGTAVVTGIGSWLPPRAVENAELANRLGSSDEWIRTRTGVRRRHVASAGMAVSDLAVEAGARALKSAGGGEADAVVLATATPDHPCPATAPDVAARLGLWSTAAFDVAAVCSGFVYALAAGTGLISAGIARRVLVIGADVFSSILDPDDRTTSVIFGDGAGAVVLRPGDPAEPGALGPFDLGSDGAGAGLITVRAGGSRQRLSGAEPGPREHFFAMAGKAVFWRAVQQMAQSAGAALDRAGWRPRDVDRLVCHQANQRITDHLADELGLPRERALSNIADVGNTAAASIPLALDQARAAGRLRPGDRVLLTAFGGGLAWGSVTLRWPSLGDGAGGAAAGAGEGERDA